MAIMTENILPILREASEAILEIYADEKRFLTELKSDNSPLTIADKRSNEIIVRRLNEIFPGIPVISEESKQIDYQTRKNFSEYFLVDPLDGTKEFIKRNGEFTINIAFMKGNLSKAGFIFIPWTGMAYVAEKASGGFRIDAYGERTMLKSKPFYLMEEGINVVASRSHMDPRTMDIIHHLNQPHMINAGSSLKFLLIAEGQANFYPRFGPTMEWDTGAAQCILEEAGGAILQTETLTPLNYNKPDLTNPSFLAIGSLLDPETLKGVIHKGSLAS
jgi:3'(2'), 5'-bisphosphate nucleotidase